jgi:hypothetical protein
VFCEISAAGNSGKTAAEQRENSECGLDASATSNLETALNRQTAHAPLCHPIGLKRDIELRIWRPIGKNKKGTLLFRPRCESTPPALADKSAAGLDRPARLFDAARRKTQIPAAPGTIRKPGMKRRDFLSLMAGAALRPLTAGAQLTLLARADEVIE